jgi:hypothetical protein
MSGALEDKKEADSGRAKSPKNRIHNLTTLTLFSIFLQSFSFLSKFFGLTMAQENPPYDNQINSGKLRL